MTFLVFNFARVGVGAECFFFYPGFVTRATLSSRKQQLILLHDEVSVHFR